MTFILYKHHQQRGTSTPSHLTMNQYPRIGLTLVLTQQVINNIKLIIL